jgi:hypothetical protein
LVPVYRFVRALNWRPVVRAANAAGTASDRRKAVAATEALALAAKVDAICQRVGRS